MKEKPAVEKEYGGMGKVNGQKAMDGSLWLTQFCCTGFKNLSYKYPPSTSRQTELLSEGVGCWGNST